MMSVPRPFYSIGAVAVCFTSNQSIFLRGKVISKTRLSVASMAGICLVISFNAHAINKEYARKLERSGCTQVTELQGCDINKTKAENAKAGFGGPTEAKPSPSPLFKDLAGTNSIGAIDTMTERGFKNVDSTSLGNTQ